MQKNKNKNSAIKTEEFFLKGQKSISVKKVQLDKIQKNWKCLKKQRIKIKINKNF